MVRARSSLVDQEGVAERSAGSPGLRLLMGHSTRDEHGWPQRLLAERARYGQDTVSAFDVLRQSGNGIVLHRQDVQAASGQGSSMPRTVCRSCRASSWGATGIPPARPASRQPAGQWHAPRWRPCVPCPRAHDAVVSSVAMVRRCAASDAAARPSRYPEQQQAPDAGMLMPGTRWPA